MDFITILYFGIFGLMIFASSLWLSVYYFNRDRIQTDPEASYLPSVTFLVPAYNEEEHISECIEALLNQDYPEEKLEIIAINDGSEDGTLEKIREFKDRIDIIDKENSGKASSINLALERVNTELVACMDADSFADPNLTKSIVGYFEEDGVKGVSTAIKVRNPTTLAQKVIWAEYVYNIFLRKLFSIFDSQWVLPGPGSIYDTEFLKQLGGWDEETLTEDMEIAFRIFKNGGKIKNSTNAYVETISPPGFIGLIKQRIRWYRGYLNNMIDYKELWFNPKYGNLGIVILPFNLLWISVVIFLLFHMSYRIFEGIITFVQTYMLIGSLPLTINVSIQALSVFHMFLIVLGILGISILLLSLRTAEEDLNLWERKIHYILFLGIYGTLFAIFWIAAIAQELRGGVKKW